MSTKVPTQYSKIDFKRSPMTDVTNNSKDISNPWYKELLVTSLSLYSMKKLEASFSCDKAEKKAKAMKIITKH